MSAKEDFDAARKHIVDARFLVRKHLALKEWPHTFSRFESLIQTLRSLVTDDPADLPPNND